MSDQVTRSAYEGMIREDIEWLERQPRTLERDHVIEIVKRSPMHEYAEPELTLTAAVQGEREAIKAHLDSDAFMPSEWAQRQPLNVYCWERGVADVMTYIDSRGPAPAVDVMAVVREYVEACKPMIGEYSNEMLVAWETRRIAALRALRALVAASPKAETKPRGDWRCTRCGEKFDIDDAKAWRLNAGQLAHNCEGHGFFVAKNYALVDGKGEAKP